MYNCYGGAHGNNGEVLILEQQAYQVANHGEMRSRSWKICSPAVGSRVKGWTEVVKRLSNNLVLAPKPKVCCNLIIIITFSKHCVLDRNKAPILFLVNNLCINLSYTALITSSLSRIFSLVLDRHFWSCTYLDRKR